MTGRRVSRGVAASRRPRAATGAAAGLVAAAAGDTVAALTAFGRSPSSGLIRAMVDRAPGALVDGGVALVGRADKPGLMAISRGVSAAAGAAGAGVARRQPLLGAAVAASPHLLGGVRALRCGDAATAGTLAATLAATAVSAVAVAPAARHGSGTSTGGGGGCTARPGASVRAAASVAVAALAASGAAARWARRSDARRRDALVQLPAPAVRLPQVPGQQRRIPGVTPLLAEPDEFPVIDITVPEPRVDLTTWRLQLDGAESGGSWSLRELLDLPLEERDLLLLCVHNPVGGSRMACARWTGIGLDALLTAAGVTRSHGWLVAEAVDGYTNVLPMADARAHGFLAFGIAGRPLPRGLGSPARLLVSGRHGQDGNLKWLRRLTVTDDPPLSYWRRRGWSSGDYPVRPGSRIDLPTSHAAVRPGPVTLRGYAWAPPVGVGEVQVRADGRWETAELGVDLGPHAWRPWSLTLDLPEGRQEIQVRCRALDGQWQSADAQPPFPHGPGGLHTVTLDVSGQDVPVRAAVHRLTDAVRSRADWTASSLKAWWASKP
ncbi:MAG: molybdopterin-dependent oxidoreductase [Actinomycetales bacterium]